MSTNAEKLRDQATGPILERIRADFGHVSVELKPFLAAIEVWLFDPDLDVPMLCRKSGLSTWLAAALIQTELGTSPWACVTDYRMQAGAELLLGTSLWVYQIAEALGYSANRDTFSEAFERWSGQRPSDYRKTHAAQAGDLGKRPEPARRVANTTEAAEEATARSIGIQEGSAYLGLISHERGAARAWAGDVDRAYTDLSFARRCYAAARELPKPVRRRRRHISVAFDTDEALSSALCTECRVSLAGDVGRTTRPRLRRALLLVPPDLPWFEVCCDECYRVVWKAIPRARLGLMDDACKAWWLSVNADPDDRETPPSRGRIIAALAEVEGRGFGDQLERQAYCVLAVADAVAIGDSLLETEARIWLGSVLRAMGRYTEARREFQETAEASRAMPWLAALHSSLMGALEFETSSYPGALELLRSATELYRPLDPHIVGLHLVAQGGVYFNIGRSEETIRLNQSALSYFDDRRDPLPASCIVPGNLAASFAQLNRLDRAEAELAKCRFDRAAHSVLAAKELFIRACLALLRRRPREALGFYGEARERFEKVHMPLEVALAAFYCVEAYARLGDRAGAIEAAAAALSFFEAAGCAQESLAAFGKLRALLEAEVIDVTAVTVSVRQLARQHGGWLPELEPA